MARPPRHRTPSIGEDNNDQKGIGTIFGAILRAVDRIQAQHMIFVVLALVFVAWMYVGRSKIDATVAASMVLFLIFAFGCFAFILASKDRELAKFKEMNEMLERQLRYAGEEYVDSRYGRPAGTKAEGEEPQLNVGRHK